MDSLSYSSSNLNTPEKLKIKKLDLSKLSISVSKKSSNLKKQKSDLNDFFRNKIENWYDIPNGELEGTILGKIYKIKRFVRKQYDLIDV